MNITMEQKIKKFFDREYADIKKYIKHLKEDNDPFCLIERVVDKTICRLLGVTQFVQGLGVKYEEIAPIYNEYKEKLEKLLESEGK